ncbi:MAG: hypothetical protein HY543_12135 [Deltaproteobacteria bacterium]|nr:hypothetical protein [Deltaproteobacteria bacterium]
MEPGDIFTVVVDAGTAGEITMEGVDPAAQFELAVINLSQGLGTATLQMSGDLSAHPDIAKAATAGNDSADRWVDLSVQEALEEELRGLELALAVSHQQQDAGAMSLAKAASAARPPQLGQTERFFVIGGLSGSRRPVEVTGRIACVTQDTVFYVDTEVDERSPRDLTQADVDTLCRDFQRTVEAELALFGEVSDVNDDGRVAVLLTPQVNRLGSSQGGFVTGFFNAQDLYVGRTSNNREILHVMVPDSIGIYGMVVEKAFVLENLLPAVLPHELQHAISYNQHVLAGGGAPEDAWLNEGLSHLAEDLLGFGVENPSRYAVYLDRPDVYPLVSAGSPGLAARGGIFLLLRYLYEQHPDGAAFLRRLVQSGQVGVPNLEAAFASDDTGFDQFGEFLMRWSATLLLNNRGISADPRFRYRTPTTAESGNLQGVCTVCSVDDNRSTQLHGVMAYPFSTMGGVALETAAVKFFEIASAVPSLDFLAPETADFAVVLVRVK